MYFHRFLKFCTEYFPGNLLFFHLHFKGTWKCLQAPTGNFRKAKEKYEKDVKNCKKEKKMSRKNTDMCEEDYKQCKRKKKKQLNKGKVKKRKAREAKRGKQSSAVAVSGKCSNITCINDMLEVLKIDKDMVQNYIQQKKRLDGRLTLAGPFEAQ